MVSQSQDRVGIRDLPVRCIVGVLAREREQAQELRVDVEFRGDFSAAVASDGVGDALDYAVAAKVIEQVLVQGKFQLLEAAAGALCDQLATRFGESGMTLQSIHVRIRKPLALGGGGVPFVALERRVS